MSTINVYTDIDTLFDTRRGIIERVIRESGNTQFTWSQYAPFYKERNIDYFEKPEWGLTFDAYLDRFHRRSTDDWVDDTYCYFYPSRILDIILPTVRSIEIGGSGVINLSAITLHVNTYPFELTDSLKTQLITHIRAAFKVKITVELLYVDFNNQTANFINNYNYVFRYGHLINREFIRWFETYPSCRLIGTKIIVPSLLSKSPIDDPILAAMNNDPIKSRIEKMSSLQAGKVIFIPISPNTFDYIDV